MFRGATYYKFRRATEDDENLTFFSGWRVKKQSFSLQEYLKKCDRRILRSNSFTLNRT